MVTDYAKDTLMITPERLDEIHERLKKGDLSIVMTHYEQDMKTPLLNLLSGNLLRVLLIQVQKTKVDLEVAMNSVDKLLKANELNFALLAAVPTCVLLGLGIREFYSLWKQRGLLYRGHIDQQIRYGLREVECLLNHNLTMEPRDVYLSHRDHGYLLIQLHYLRELVLQHRLLLDIDRFMEDLRDIEANDQNVLQRLNTVQRMYRTYVFLH
jgi:nuclear-control-of-ATPase protein 2